MAPEAGPAGGEASPPGWQQVETLGLAEVVMTILEARQTMPSSNAAAVSREQHGDVLHVRVSLLSDPPASGGDSPGPGEPGVVVADFAARRLGQDLADAFKDNEVIILKLSRAVARRERMIRLLSGAGGEAGGPLLQPFYPGPAERR